MNFQAKNFKYTTKALGEFLDEITNGSQQYLRSLSAEQPSERPANFVLDFPELAADFFLPPELQMVLENFHSSSLRISGPVNMWLHYDVSVLTERRGWFKPRKLPIESYVMLCLDSNFKCNRILLAW